MATNYKVLGQSSPSASADTTLYAVPSSTQAVISSLVVCNRDLSPVDFRLAVRPAGASIQPQHYLIYDAPLDGNSTATFVLGITLEATDVVTVYSHSASLSFNAFGSEITA